VLPAAYWSVPAEQLLAALGSRPEGLADDEAARRLQRSGPNTIADDPREGALALAARQLANPLVLMLVFAAALSLVLRDWLDAMLVLVIVLASAALGFAQEWRASRAIGRLRSRLALTALVRRAGQARSVPAATIVPGDVMVLAAGNLVPADGVVLDARDFLVTEASLTGESFPVEKHAGAVPSDAGLAARLNCVYLGTSVRSGTASVLVVRTGRSTELGGIAGRLQARRPETDFARGLRHFGHLLLRVMFAIVLAVLTINLLLERPLLDSLLFAVALAVGLSPELLPAIVSVTLAQGARAMAASGVLVRRLEAIENLGGIDILCTDKTGTLTEGIVTLRGAVGADAAPSAALRGWAFLNALLQTGIENPLDTALVTASRAEGFSTAGWRKVDEIPYDFLRKCLSIVIARDDEPQHCLFVTKGAFSEVLARCTRVREGVGEAALSGALRERVAHLQREFADQGLRVLGVATRRVPARSRYERDDERDMCLEGLLAFFDPPRAEAARVVAELRALGIGLKIVSGDSRQVVAHLAEAVGLDRGALITGAEIAGLKDEALWQRAEQAQLFVEVDPQQKERIVRALQKSGHSVGYLGDGINDVPALHAADVGISVDGAADAAREGADIVLLRHDLEVLHDGVVQGRRSFANTLKYISITTSANFGNMLSMALATLFLPFLPLLAKQILLNNLLSDIPSMAIATDRVDPGAVLRPQRWNLHDVRRFMVVFGLVSTAFDLLAFVLLRQVFDVDAATFHTAWFVVSLLTELAVVLVLRTPGPALASRPSAPVLAATAAVAAVALALPYAGLVATALGFVAPGKTLLATMLVVVLAYAATTEAVKRRMPWAQAAGGR
jgi:Mg2+-importing ATPase